MGPRAPSLRLGQAGPSRSTVVLGLLLGALALVAGLAWEAISAMQARSALTEGILEDYAELASNSYAARLRAELEIFAFAPALERLGTGVGATLPAPAPIEVETEPSHRLSIPLVRSYFRVPLRGGDLVGLGADMSAEERARMADTLRAAATTLEREAWSSAAAFLPGRGDSTRAFVYRLVRDPVGRPAEIAGFEASLAGLAVYFEYSFTFRALVPPPLTRGSRQDSLVSIEVLAPAGAEVYRSPWVHRSRWQHTQPLGARFGNLTARATLASDAPARIIAPGPTGGRAGLLLALGGVCVALIVASIFQIRRESELQTMRIDFVSSASHELRTPLAQIRLFAETLRLGRVRDEEERKRSLAIIDQEAGRLSHLVENLLTFSRAERRRLTVAPTLVDLSALVTEITSGFEPLAAAHDSHVAFEAPADLLVRADRDAVRQIVLNLLDNAVKYGPAGQTIRIVLRAVDHRVELSVTDQGPGIAPADRERVWQRFVRLPQRDGTRTTGAGIGLSVVRELTELHGGTTRVEDADGHGARLVVELPDAEGM